jgi:NADH-quinone oxidoreductase subunit B
LREAVGKERRPLSWVVGDQRAVRPPMPSMRDLKQRQRQQMADLPAPDHV